MKKISLLLASALLIMMLAACGSAGASSSPTPSSVSSAPANVEGALADLMAKVYEGIPEDELPALIDTELNAENSTYYAGVESSAYKEGLASEAMMNAVAHSVVLLRAESAEAAETLKDDVAANVDPRKWVCVEAEKVITDNIGDLVILIMASEAVAPQLHENFLALAQ